MTTRYTMILLLCMLLLCSSCSTTLGYSTLQTEYHATTIRDTDADFNLTQEEMIAKIKKYALFGDLAPSQEYPPQKRNDYGTQIIRYYYHTSASLLVTIDVRKNTEKVTAVGLQEAVGTSQTQFAVYAKTLLNSFIDFSAKAQDYNEIYAYFNSAIMQAQRTGYGKQTVHYNDYYLIYQENTDTNRSLTIKKVASSAPWVSLAYYDGSNFHLFYDSKGLPRPYTTEDIALLQNNKHYPEPVAGAPKDKTHTETLNNTDKTIRQ